MSHHKIKNGTVFKEENTDIRINSFWESANSVCFLTVLKGLNPYSIMHCTKTPIKKHSLQARLLRHGEREKNPIKHRDNSPAAAIPTMMREIMLHIYIRQLHDTSKNKDVTTVIKDNFGSPVRINSTQSEFWDGGILVMSFSCRVMLQFLTYPVKLGWVLICLCFIVYVKGKLPLAFHACFPQEWDLQHR